MKEDSVVLPAKKKKVVKPRSKSRQSRNEPKLASVSQSNLHLAKPKLIKTATSKSSSVHLHPKMPKRPFKNIASSISPRETLD